MNRKLTYLLTFLTMATWLSATSPCHGAGTFGPNPETKPSVFAYAFAGLGVGTLAGLSVGYIVERHRGFESPVWRPLAISSGIGLLSGIGLGLTMGTIDLFSDKPGVGGIVIRDMLYGELLGIAAGLVGGGISTIAGNSAEHLLFGAALGCLIGSGVGLVFGIIEGRVIMRRHYNGRQASAPRITLSVATIESHRGKTLWMPTLRGTF